MTDYATSTTDAMRARKLLEGNMVATVAEALRP